MRPANRLARVDAGHAPRLRWTTARTSQFRAWKPHFDPTLKDGVDVSQLRIFVASPDIDFDQEPEKPDLLSEPALPEATEDQLAAFEAEENDPAINQLTQRQLAEKCLRFVLFSSLRASSRFAEPVAPKPQLMTRGDRHRKVLIGGKVRIARPQIEVFEERAAMRQALKSPRDKYADDLPGYGLLIHHLPNGEDAPGELLGPGDPRPWKGKEVA